MERYIFLWVKNSHLKRGVLVLEAVHLEAADLLLCVKILSQCLACPFSRENSMVV